MRATRIERSAQPSVPVSAVAEAVLIGIRHYGNLQIRFNPPAHSKATAENLFDHEQAIRSAFRNERRLES